MKKIALIVILSALLMSPDAESGSVFRDINGDGRMGLEEVICTLQSTAELRIDKKVGLPDALYVLKILAGSEGNAEETGMFRAYRADVLKQLQNTAKDEENVIREYNEYTTLLSNRLPDVCITLLIPGVTLDIAVSQDKRYFKLTASHENIKGYVWSLDSNWIFAVNDVIIPYDIRTYGLDRSEALQFYRKEVTVPLNSVRGFEKQYFSEFETYADTLLKLGYTPRPYNSPVHIEILAATKDYFKLKGTHDEAPDYVWTYDSATNQFMENGVIYIPEVETIYWCTLDDIAAGSIEQFLRVILKSEEAYHTEHQVYTDKLPDMGLNIPSAPDGITIDIRLGNNGQSYIAKATHPILDCVWTINEKAELLKVPK